MTDTKLTHATQLALMVVWAGSARHESVDPITAWTRMFGEDDDSEVEALSNACDLTAVGQYLNEKSIHRRLPSCPMCATLCDFAREQAPV